MMKLLKVLSILAMVLFMGAPFASAYLVPQISQLGTRQGYVYNIYTGPGPTNVDNSAIFNTYTSPPFQGGYSPGGIRYMLGLRQAVPYAYNAIQMPYYWQSYYAYPYVTFGGGYGYGGNTRYGSGSNPYFFSPGGMGSF